MTDFNETNFNNWFRENWYGFFSRLEPGRGATFGSADVLVIIEGKFFPIELKIAKIHHGKLICRKIRPQQIYWHNQAVRFGGITFFLVCVGDIGYPERLFLFQGKRANEFLEPVNLGSIDEIDVKNFNQSLSNCIWKSMFCLGK